MIVLDTSVVVAFMNRRDDDHERVVAWMASVVEYFLTTPLVVANIDHLVSRGGGLTAARAFYEDLSSGAYLVEWWLEAVAELWRWPEHTSISGLRTHLCSRSLQD